MYEIEGNAWNSRGNVWYRSVLGFASFFEVRSLQSDSTFLKSKPQFCNYVLNVSIRYRKFAILILKVLIHNRKAAITNSFKYATAIPNVKNFLIRILSTHLRLKVLVYRTTNSFERSHNGLSTTKLVHCEAYGLVFTDFGKISFR